MDLDLPFKIEYARHGSTITCKQCQEIIAKDKLQIAEMVQSQRHDGKDPVWFHQECFLSSHRVHSRDEFANFEGINYDDQLDILMKIDKNSNFEQIAYKRANEKPLKSSDVNNFGVEYSTSSDDKCWVCKEQIMRTELRFKKTVYNSEIAAEFGKEILWNHLHCFIEKREIFDFIHGGNRLPGYDQLQSEHRQIIRDVLPPFVEDDDDDESDVQSIEEEPKQQLDKQPKAIETLEEKIANQTAELLRVRQALQKVCTPEELQFFLVANDSDVIEDVDSALDRCADILTFGALYKCQKCFQGDMIFTKYGYTCNGMIDEWVKCGNSDNMPLRLKCFIPQEFRHKSFFATCEPRVEHRAFRPLVDSPAHRPIAHQLPGPSRLKKVENLKLRNGTAVDPKSMLDHVAHVFRTKETLYSSVLGLTDIEKNKNSYFKLQVLESDVLGSLGAPNYWLFTCWGRIGTDIGDTLVEQVNSAEKACAMFKKTYEKQTGNEWNSGDTFKKQVGKFYPIDVNYSDDIEANTSVASLLSPQVEELMKLLFNIKNMKTAMKEFKLDLEKMPLGKLSVKQLQAAYLALGELEDAINHDRSMQDLVGLSNKFYTFVPHNFGLAKAPVIDTLDSVNAKREMVDSLLDIEHAYALMVQAGNGDINSFDGYYKQLKADIQPLDRNSLEFQQIETYTRNTTVHQFKIEIFEVFKVCRHEERQRFQQFKHFNNRMLLWHGSRTTNFASIISNGLKISAQINGSMFGRGIYFADMVSKSANYCQAQGMPEALMVLGEVALGNMHELRNATAITAPPAGYHSVKGVGRTVPDLSKAHTRQDGVIIPLGVPANANTNRLGGVYGGGGLLFNEYIVYNEAQVNIQYLVKIKIT